MGGGAVAGRREEWSKINPTTRIRQENHPLSPACDAKISSPPPPPASLLVGENPGVVLTEVGPTVDCEKKA